MSNIKSKPLRLHSHPAMERQLNIPHGHVIIDSNVFLALVNIHGNYVSTINTNQVATLRLPVSVKALAAITDALTQQYGPGLTMRQHGEFMIVEKPDKESGGAFCADAPRRWRVDGAMFRHRDAEELIDAVSKALKVDERENLALPPGEQAGDEDFEGFDECEGMGR
jgi:hypothetical protein